jgi:hypothetical protein
MPQYTLDFPVNVGSSAPVKSLAEAVREVAERTKLGEGNLRAFDQILAETAQRTGSVKTALGELASKQNVFQSFAKEVQAYTREAEKAQGETQKWGRMMEQASQENAKRDQRAADSARKSADEIIKQHERIQSVLGRQGARLGGTALGQSVGLPGIGRGAGALLGAMDLSGGTMAAIGGAAAGVFAGVEFTKSLDNLAKWAQQQKNAAAETGVTITEMEQLSRTAERTGINMVGVAKATSEFTKEMMQGGPRAREIQSALSQLGLSASVAFEKPYKALTDIEAALGNVTDPAARAQLAVALLGEEGRKLAASLDAARESSGKGIIDEKAMAELVEARQKMSDLGDKYDLIKSKFAVPLNLVLDVVGWAADKSAPNAQGHAWWMGPFSAGTAPKPKPEADYSEQAAASDAAAGAERNRRWQAFGATHGQTPGDIYSSKMAQIDTDTTALHDKAQAGTLSDTEVTSQRTQLEARKASAEASRKAAEKYQSQHEAFQQARTDPGFNPTDPGDILKQFREFPKRYDLLGHDADYKKKMAEMQGQVPGAAQQLGRNMLEHQLPGLATGDYSKLYSPMGKQDKEFTDGLSRQERQARESNEHLKKASEDRIAEITRTASDQTEINESNLHLHTAQRAALTQQTANQRDLSPAGVAQLAYKDQTKEIAEAFAAKAAPITKSIADLQATPGADDEQRQKIALDIAKRQSDLQKLENDQLTQSVDALSKFNESVDKASKAIGEEFGGFISGLAAAGREGHAGSYAKSFVLGQSDKMISNMASSLYKPGMFQLPGQGTPDNPTPLGKALSGTLLGMDPKAQQAKQAAAQGAALQKSSADTLAAIKANTAQLQKSAQAATDPKAGKDSALASADATLTSATDLNTKATQDNTAALLAVYQGLGGDPTSLGIAGLPAFTPISLGGSSAPLSVLAEGGGALSSAVRAAAASGATGGTSVTSSIRYAGESDPSAHAIPSPVGALNSLSGAAKSIGGPSAISQPGWSTGAGVYGPTDANGIPIIPGVTDTATGYGPSVTSSVSYPGLSGQLSTGPFGSDGQLSTGPSGTVLNFDPDTSDNWDSMAGDLSTLANGSVVTPSVASAVTSLPQSLSDIPVSNYQIATGAQSLSAALAPAFTDILKTGAAFNAPVPQMAPTPNSFFTSSNPLTNLFNTNGTATTGQEVGAGLQVAGEAYGAYTGIRQMTKGGAQNVMAGLGTTAMSIAPLLGPAAPFVEAGGALLSIVAGIMGNPIQERQAHINSELFNNQYIAPEAYTRTMDISGGYASMGFRGNVRATDLSSIPVLQQAYPDPRHGLIVPGAVLSPFGGGGPSSFVPIGAYNQHTTVTGSDGSQGGQGTPAVVNNHYYSVSAIDGDSVANFFQTHSQALGDGVVTALNKGGSDMTNRLRTI